jgi:F-type H+-transporting ATPase subunit gamma
MARREQIEQQIETIDGMRDIIHAMRSLAATYLTRAQKRLAGLRAYADTIGRAIEDCLFGRDIALPERQARGTVIVAFFSEQGLCGRFNEIVAEAAARHGSQVESPRFVVVGRRGRPLLRRLGMTLAAGLPSISSPNAVDAIIHRVAGAVLELHGRGGFRQAYLLYARYLSPGRVEPRFERVLPVDLSQWREGQDAGRVRPRLGLSRIDLLRELVNEYAFISLFQAMTESLASENGMRLRSMEAARSNIDETLDDLRRQSRIQRQNEITEELLDLVGGAEALERSRR